jgi:hypothetical protein
MESSTESRCGEIVSDLAIILVTGANLIFFAFFHKYIAWYTIEADGTIARLSVLTDDYFTWLPFPVTASIVVIVANAIMIVFNRSWFRQAAWVVFCLIGITMVVSLLSIFPFDFSVIPDATVAMTAPKWVTVSLILMAVFYGISALVLSAKLLSTTKAR